MGQTYEKANCIMPTANDYFPKPASKYFRATEFDKEIVLTIAGVSRVEFTNDGVTSAKPVLGFSETDQALVLNKTNFSALAMMFGEDSDDWRGEKVVLYPGVTDFKGRSMPTIKVRRPQKTAAATAAAARSKHPFDDKVPF
jgi:hypothetical protein